MTKISLLLFLFIFWRGIRPLPCQWWIKLLLAIPAGAVAFKFKLIRILGGHYFAPDLPCSFLLLCAWLYAVLFIWSFMLVFTDTILFGHTLFSVLTESPRRWGKLLQRHKYLTKIHAATLALAVICACIGMYYGLAMPRIRQVTVRSAHVPPEADGMKITLLADLHVDGYNGPERMKKIVDLANTLDPDIVCIVGDFADGSKKWHLDALSELVKFRTRAGIFGVVGNHEYYSGYGKLMTHFKNIELPILVNENRLLEKYNVRVCGITDKQAKRYRQPMPDIPKALAGGKKGEFKLFLSHRPDTAREAAEHGAHLQLSGHTHGGMVWGFDLLVGHLNGGHAWGEHDINGMTLVISNGTCIWSNFPIRLGRPGEILLITLKRVRQAEK